MCRVLKVSRSGFYGWARDEESKRATNDRELSASIRESFKKSRDTYGARRIRRDLFTAGKRVGRKRVRRLMKALSLRPKGKKQFRVCTTDSKHGFAPSPNLLNREFAVDTLNTVYLSDLTYIQTGEGWLYLTTVMDMCSRLIVGWSMSETMETSVTTIPALEMALGRRSVSPGLIFHSDRGVQYADRNFRKLVDANGINQSMSRKGNCWDNAPAESFFHTLKTELDESFASRQEARAWLFEYIEVFYNRNRLHSSIGYMSPADFEAAAAEVAAA